MRYECGTRDVTSILGIGAAIDFMNDIGMAKVADYGRELGVYLHTRLQQIDGVTVLTPADSSMRAGMTTFRTEQVTYDEMYRKLAGDYKLRCRIVTERGLNAIRVSTHVFNNKAACDRVADAVTEILAAG